MESEGVMGLRPRCPKPPHRWGVLRGLESEGVTGLGHGALSPETIGGFSEVWNLGPSCAVVEGVGHSALSPHTVGLFSEVWNPRVLWGLGHGALSP